MYCILKTEALPGHRHAASVPVSAGWLACCRSAVVEQLAGRVAPHLQTRLEAASPPPAAFALMAALIRSFGPTVAGAGMTATDHRASPVELLSCNQHCHAPLCRECGHRRKGLKAYS